MRFWPRALGGLFSLGFSGFVAYNVGSTSIGDAMKTLSPDSILRNPILQARVTRISELEAKEIGKKLQQDMAT